MPRIRIPWALAATLSACAPSPSDTRGVDRCANVRCTPGTTCRDGACRVDCAAGAERCADRCVDLATALDHCGACGNPCRLDHAEPACRDGACAIAACAPGFADCDGVPATGCEADLVGDVNRCGSCGNVCPPSMGAGEVTVCEVGVCRAVCAAGTVRCGGACRASCDNWRWANPDPGPNSLFSVAFADAEIGVAGGARSLLRTPDGGRSWAPVTGAPIDWVWGIDFVTPTRAVAVGFNLTSPQTGGLQSAAMTSDDAGRTWTLRPLPLRAGDDIRDVSFDGIRGAAVGFYGTGGYVLVSRDGGVTWTSALLEAAPTGTLNWFHGVHVRGDSIWVAGTRGLRHSADFGATWTTPAQAPTGRLEDVRFADDQVGLAVGYSEDIWRTDDGGKTWGRVHGGGPSGNWLRAVHWFDSIHAIAVGFSGITFLSADGGRNWSGTNPYPFTYLFAVASQGPTAWTVGTRGVIFRSDDHGATWTRQTRGFNASFLGMSFPDPLRGYAAGEIGGIVGTRDGGKTWQLVLGQYAPYARANPFLGTLGNAFRGVHFRTASEGWVVGDPVSTGSGQTLTDSVILHTTDEGATWTLQPSGVRASLRAVGFSSALKGWAVGGGVALRTVDGGRSWQPSPVVAGQDLRDVAVLSDDVAWVCGSGLIAHTEDGGASWVKVAKPLGIQFTIRFADALHGIAAGISPTVIGGETTTQLELTEDGGRTWMTSPWTMGGLPWATALAPDLKNGVLLDINGKILRTADGGRSWAVDAHPMQGGFYDVRAVSGGWVVVGDFGAILRGPTVAPY